MSELATSIRRGSPLLFATVLVAGACAQAPSGGAAPAPSAAGSAAGSAAASGGFNGTILFGAPISLTGSTTKEGNYTKNGYEIWKDDTNAKGGIAVGGKHYKVDIKYYDDESNGPKSATLADKLIKEDKVNFLLGPYGSAPTLQVSTVAEKNKVPMIDAEGAAEAIYSQGYQYTFGVLSPAPLYMRGLIEMAAAQSPKPTTVAILTADDSFSVEVASDAQKDAQRVGLNVVYFAKYPSASTDLRAPLTEAKAKSPDLVLNSGHLQESLAIMQQSKELGFNPKGFGFTVGPSFPDFYATLKSDANDVFGGTQWTKDLKYTGDDLWKTGAAYNDEYNKRFGEEPPYQAAMATAAGIAYQKALEKAGTLDPKAVRDAIAKLDFMSFAGQIKFDERGINTFKPMAVEQWQSGKKVTVWPANVAVGKPIWPTPPFGSR
jgi:branched-chain amino acid transport system substrate-binding protein